MTPLLKAVLPYLLSLLPSPKEAAKIITDSDTRKDNALKPSSVIGLAGVAASPLLMLDPEQPPEAVICALVASLALYFYRRQMQEK